MYRLMNEREKQWIDKLMDVELKGRDILLKQFSKARISYKQEYDFISLKFHVDGNYETYPYRIRVPVEMRAFQRASAPIVFLLHVLDGVIDELEIFTADSSRIDENSIELTSVEYEVN